MLRNWKGNLNYQIWMQTKDLKHREEVTKDLEAFEEGEDAQYCET